MAVKGFMKSVSEALDNFTKKVGKPDSRKNYEDNTREGFSARWSLWYNNMLYSILTHYSEIAGLKGAAKVLKVAELVKESSEQYRKARMVLFAKEKGREIVRDHNLIEEAASASVESILGGITA